MICKLCNDLIGLPGKWHPHSRLKTPAASSATANRASPGQTIYTCSACQTVLLKGRNTGWSLAA